MQKIFVLSFYFLVIILSCTSCNQDEGNSGKVIAVLDGDTYDVLMKENKTVRVRMEGIDAPEKGMPFYRVSKNYLAELCFGKNISLVENGMDKHGRTLAFSYLDDGRELSHEMIKAGLAWHFKQYSSDSILAGLEVAARNSRAGLWADNNPMAPWENRRLHRAGISTKDSFEITQNDR